MENIDANQDSIVNRPDDEPLQAARKMIPTRAFVSNLKALRMAADAQMAPRDVREFADEIFNYINSSWDGIITDLKALLEMYPKLIDASEVAILGYKKEFSFCHEEECDFICENINDVKAEIDSKFGNDCLSDAGTLKIKMTEMWRHGVPYLEVYPYFEFAAEEPPQPVENESK